MAVALGAALLVQHETGAAMTRPCVFALGLTLGCLVSPAAQILAARYCDRHVLTN